MKKIVKLKEADLNRLVKRVIEEQNLSEQTPLGVAYNIQLGDKYQTLVNTINKGDLAKLARQIKDALGSII